MIIKIVEYTIKAEALENVTKAIQLFIEAIHKNEPRTYYEAFKKGESLDFIHLMKFPDTIAEEKHKNAAYTNDFVKILYPNCVNEPRFIDLTSI